MKRHFQLTTAAIFVSLALLTLAARAQQTQGSISGVVVDGDGAALPGVSVTATNTGNNQSFTTTTDSDGNFRIGDLQPGTYDVKVEASGFASSKVTGVEVNVGQSSSLTITLGLSKYGRVEGKVTRRGSPVAGVTVFVKDGDGKEHSADTGADGSYSIARVAPGKRVEVWVVEPPRYRRTRFSFELKERGVRDGQNFVQR